MAGQRGRSGRKPNTLTRQRAQAALQRLTPKAPGVIEKALDSSDLELAVKTAWAVIYQVDGKPRQQLENTGGDGGPSQHSVQRFEVTPETLATALITLHEAGVDVNTAVRAEESSPH